MRFMKWYKYLPVVWLGILLLSCTKDTSTTGNSVAASTELNIAYGTAGMQKMDMYLPAGRTATTTKVIVLIHGGSWTSGDKADLKPYIDSLQKRLPGYAIFNINYRLSAKPTNIFPTQEEDVKAALGFIYSQLSAYLVSDKFAFVGVSAGAHLAMLQGYKNTAPVKPKAIASFSGPGDLIDMYNHPAGGNLLIPLALAEAVGVTPLQDSMVYAKSSPINFISASSPPTILFQGGVDPLVSVGQAAALQAKLQTNGVANQYIFYPTAAHIGFWDNATMYDAFNKLQAFIEANVL